MRSLQSMVREYARQLDDTPWPTVLGYAYASFITLALLFLLTPTAWHGPVKTIGLALPLMLLAAKDLASIPDVAVRLRALRRQDAGWPALLAACLPSGLIGMARLERDIWRGFFGWLRRKPQPARPAWRSPSSSRAPTRPSSPSACSAYWSSCRSMQRSCRCSSTTPTR